jgi:CheY-like chemotaxis protein
MYASKKNVTLFSHNFHIIEYIFTSLSPVFMYYLFRERDSLNTVSAFYRNITLTLCGSKMSVMQDRDAADTLPDGGDMSIWNKSTLYGAHSLANPTQQQVREQGSSHRILVVEDDSSLANLEADILTAHGYMVAIASNGEMAITVLEQALPDLVLLDLDLSGTINGWDVLQILRTYSATPVLLTSAESAVNRQIRIRGETRSTLDLLPKPYLMQTLLKRIERMLTIAPY